MALVVMVPPCVLLGPTVTSEIGSPSGSVPSRSLARTFRPASGQRWRLGDEGTGKPFTLNVWLTLGATFQLALPPCEAVMVTEPAAVKVRFVPLEIKPGPLVIAKVTV